MISNTVESFVMSSNHLLASGVIVEIVLVDWLSWGDLVRFDTALCNREIRRAIIPRLSCLSVNQPYSRHKDESKYWKSKCFDIVTWMNQRKIFMTEGLWTLPLSVWSHCYQGIRDEKNLLSRLKNVRIVCRRGSVFSWAELSACPLLEELHLVGLMDSSSNSLGDDDLAQHVPLLKKLKLYQCDLSVGTMGSFGKHPALVDIECLHCSYSLLELTNQALSVPCLSFFRKITTLEVIGSSILRVLQPFFDQQSILKKASFQNFGDLTEDLIMMQFLAQVPSIEALKLSFCSNLALPQGVSTFLPNLQSLVLEASYIPSMSFFAALNANCKRLETLQLCGEVIYRATESSLQFLPVLTEKLESFSTDVLGSNSLFPNVHHTLFPMPPNHLKRAELSNQSRWSDESKAIMKFLRKSPHIERLLLRDCGLHPASVLQTIATQCPAMRHLSMENCHWNFAPDTEAPIDEPPKGMLLESLTISARREDAIPNQSSTDNTSNLIEIVLGAVGMTLRSCEIAFFPLTVNILLHRYLPNVEELTIHVIRGEILTDMWRELPLHCRALRRLRIYEWAEWVKPAHRTEKLFLSRCIYGWTRF